MSLTCVTDLRGKGKWTPQDYARLADLWIVDSSWQERPLVTGRVLAYINPAILLRNGQPYSAPGSFNSALGGLPLLDLKPLWVGAGGEELRAIDITKRGVVNRIVDAVRTKLAWADGVEICYFTNLDWHDPGRYAVEFWEKWDNSLMWLADSCSSIKGGNYLVVVQQFHLTSPCMASNGLYLEGNGPYDFRYTPAKHAEELKRMREFLLWQDPGREVVWVQEFRQPGLYSTSDLTQMIEWAHNLGIYTSAGRDGTARGA